MRLSGKSLPAFVVCLLLGAGISGQTITEFPVSEGGRPGRIVAGADGNLWFLDVGSPTIGRITTTGSVVEFPIEGPALGIPFDIAWGPDGSLWVTETEYSPGGAIVRMTPSGAVMRFGIHPELPYAIAAGSDGNLWFTMSTEEPGSWEIGRITIGGEFRNFPLPPPGDISLNITAGPDGNLWFTEPSSNKIGRITPTGTITEFSIPTSTCGPRGVITGSDGNLWFTCFNAAKVGRITTTGVVAELPVPAPALNIAAGPDGNLWFTQSASRLGQITPSGVVTEIPIPAPAFDVTAGPDGNIWFTESTAGKIGRLALVPTHESDVRILPVVGSTQGVGGTFFRTSVQLHNSTTAPTTGRILFHPSGVSDAGSDPGRFFYYSLQPGQTLSIADLLPALGISGVGSADIQATSGSMPTTVVRVFNDGGEAGTMGFVEEPMHEESALSPGRSGVLLLPADLTNFRFNVGVRTLWDGATVTLTLRDGAGVVVATNARVFPATYHEQQSATAFLGTSTLPAGGSISIAVDSGAAFFYGATVDNTTGDPSLQIAHPER
jgi:streptogramin lyase